MVCFGLPAAHGRAGSRIIAEEWVFYYLRSRPLVVEQSEPEMSASSWSADGICTGIAEGLA